MEILREYQWMKMVERNRRIRDKALEIWRSVGKGQLVYLETAPGVGHYVIAPKGWRRRDG